MPELRHGKRVRLVDFRRHLDESDPEASRFELLEGRLVQKPSRSLRQVGALDKIQECVTSLVTAGWQLQIGVPFVDAESYVEPGAAIVRERLPQMAAQPVSAGDITLVIEVSDTSLASDRRSKGRIYSRADIPYYWLLNVLDSQLEIFTRPSGPVAMPGYHEQRIYRPDDTVSVVVADGEIGSVRVADLIP